MYLELSIAICGSMLAIASILDIKNREVPDKIWLLSAAAGAIVAALALFSDGEASDRAASAIHYAIGIAIISPIGYLAYRTGLFGGADPKALVAIAVIFPDAPAGIFAVHGFPVISILSNALVVSVAAMLYNVISNSITVARGISIFEGMDEGLFRKALAFAVGFPSSSPGQYVFAMEGMDNSGNRKFMFNPASYDDFAQLDNKTIWVTRALPFIVYLGIGYAMYMVIGDLFAVFLNLVMP